MEKSPASLILKGTRSNPRGKCHLTRVRLADHQTQKQVLATVERLAPYIRLMGRHNGAATVANSMEVPPKIKNRTTTRFSNSTSGYLSKRMLWKIYDSSAWRVPRRPLGGAEAENQLGTHLRGSSIAASPFPQARTSQVQAVAVWAEVICKPLPLCSSPCQFPCVWSGNCWPSFGCFPKQYRPPM